MSPKDVNNCEKSLKTGLDGQTYKCVKIIDKSHMIQGKIKNQSASIAAGPGLFRLDYFLIILLLITLILFINYWIMGWLDRRKSNNQSLTTITTQSEDSACQSPSEPSKSVDIVRLHREPRPGSITRSETIRTDHYVYYSCYSDSSVIGVTSSTTYSNEYDLEQGESKKITPPSEFTHL